MLVDGFSGLQHSPAFLWQQYFKQQQSCTNPSHIQFSGADMLCLLCFLFCHLFAQLV
jgi:hypothetical protein